MLVAIKGALSSKARALVAFFVSQNLRHRCGHTHTHESSYSWECVSAKRDATHVQAGFISKSHSPVLVRYRGKDILVQDALGTRNGTQARGARQGLWECQSVAELTVLMAESLN